MRRLSTLVYAPVVFTALVGATSACGPRRAARVATIVNRPPVVHVPMTARPGPPKGQRAVVAKVIAGWDLELARQIDAEEATLYQAYLVPFRRPPGGPLPPLRDRDPADIAVPVRREIADHLRRMIDLIERRLAIEPRPQLMLDHKHARFMLAQYEALIPPKKG